MEQYKRIFKEDLVKGGKADDVKFLVGYSENPKESENSQELFTFDIEQIKKGLKVELEHTEDPEIALEITLDHLTEFEDYYDRLEKAEEK